VLITVFAVLLVLQEAGVDIKTVLGGAAIIGVAIAFGAQDLMKDYFSGFLILLEDQYQLGDLVTISGITGTVESVNMRVTVLRDLEGRVHFVPNGSIDHVTNRTYAWGRPVFEVPVRFDEILGVRRHHQVHGEDPARPALPRSTSNAPTNQQAVQRARDPNHGPPTLGRTRRTRRRRALSSCHLGVRTMIVPMSGARSSIGNTP
jgi:hypothetical protein